MGVLHVSWSCIPNVMLSMWSLRAQVAEGEKGAPQPSHFLPQTDVDRPFAGNLVRQRADRSIAFPRLLLDFS